MMTYLYLLLMGCVASQLYRPTSIHSVLKSFYNRLWQLVPFVHDAKAEEMLSDCCTASGFEQFHGVPS